MWLGAAPLVSCSSTARARGLGGDQAHHEGVGCCVASSEKCCFVAEYNTPLKVHTTRRTASEYGLMQITVADTGVLLEPIPSRRERDSFP